ncbi:precorrin-6A reductase [Lachnospiraceae bacterium 42-17]|jgi:precorrin-6Y C5,15-methyltransferase (decarboxylating)|nr:precorrin-6A reductase [Dorea sp.]
MSEKKVIIFGGTTEGRRLTEYVSDAGISAHVCTATQYGENLLPLGEQITVSHERMGCDKMCGLIRSLRPLYVIDATHPYAKEVTENVRAACDICSVKYLRLVRERGEEFQDVIFVESTEEAAGLLREIPGNVLVTTGSRELERYTVLDDYKERIYARILPAEESIIKCEKLGIRGRHLICMQGPFSTELNTALIREYDIACMVTKDSGAAGGVPQKYEAAKAAGIKLIVIGRPKEEGFTCQEIIRILEDEPGLCHRRKRKVILAGIGPGDFGFLTKQARAAIKKADLIIGAKRMTDAVAERGQEVYTAYKPEEIVAYIKEHPEYSRIVAAFSGDTGFYSGAGKLLKLLEEEPDMEPECMPGISSVSCFCARLGISWEDAAFLSVHGRKGNPLSVIRGHEKTFVLTGSSQDVREICLSMTEADMGALPVCIGVNLSYENEQIFRGTAKEYTRYDGGKLSILYIYNPLGRNSLTVQGLPDSSFLRGNVPMTKEEVRCVCISKLRICKNSVIYDVGAGTGSVSVEAALKAPAGCVYAIEKNEEAAGLIRENSRRLGTDNLTVIKGEAPEIFRDLPVPDCVFIGGSGGCLRDILGAVIQKNFRVRIVISAITLETLTEAAKICKSIKKKEEEILQLTVAKARLAGKYHMMTGQNPVYIISFTCDEEEKGK